jgi:hypothetical protein
MKAKVKCDGRNIEVVRYCSTVRGDMFECLSTGKRYFHDELELEDEYHEPNSGKVTSVTLYEPKGSV